MSNSRDDIQYDINNLTLTAAQFRGTLMGVLRTAKQHPELAAGLKKTETNLREGIAHLEKGIEALNAQLALLGKPA